ncbi:mitochondrial fission regulator 2 [Ambystoma mexicanum]|uniref:mitochondrial fission regulator 2 n=1 Tax=Ambystoma mexicanum TaxID=8296 RepID=UPI0037E8F005
MSLLLGLLRQLFQYFGIPVERLDSLWEYYRNSRNIVRLVGTHLPSNPFPRVFVQLIPVWDFKEYGCTRSVIRMIGAILPLNSCPRPRFQCVVEHSAMDCDNCVPRNPHVASLADVAWLVKYRGESYAVLRNGISTSKDGKVTLYSKPVEMSDLLAVPEDNVQGGSYLAQNNETIQKIAALEDELTRLRAQIAVIVAKQEARDSCAAVSFISSPMIAPPRQGLTSTPLSALVHHPPIPPPPPPPLPPANPDFSNSVVSLIKRRRAANGNPSTTETVKQTAKETAESMPSMMDVLKDLNKIQLRAVERSPGGTPVMKKGKKRDSLSDPAELIAYALKKKFSHRKNDDSFGKENKSFESSPFSSPDTPVFGRHLLKPSGRRPHLGANQAANVSAGKVGMHI